MRINNIELKNKIIFITGAAGFIGSNLASMDHIGVRGTNVVKNSVGVRTFSSWT